jgi:hypothetical protein
MYNFFLNLSGSKKIKAFVGSVKIGPGITVYFKTGYTAGWKMENIFRNRIGKIGNSVIVRKKQPNYVCHPDRKLQIQNFFPKDYTISHQ